jgi:hypothetical protein
MNRTRRSSLRSTIASRKDVHELESTISDIIQSPLLTTIVARLEMHGPLGGVTEQWKIMRGASAGAPANPYIRPQRSCTCYRSRRRVQPPPCADVERLHLRTTGAGAANCADVQKRSMLNCMFHNVKVITRAGPYAANESEAGRWLALAEGEGRPPHQLGRRPGAVRLVRAYPSNQTEGDHLCRCYGFMSRPIVRFGAAIPMISAASCILYTGCELAIS